ncbi:hypothetical protein E2K99_24730 [Herbaspirillum huttiense]|uniref:hypothetical protein n=1 Tax=Herbaspirillum huttiense TaxID=863372 RepID=UPI00106605E0|nr:hypothetical protein [Herbaspirillum huttiense]QBP77984.1 hypothetical protein E2K99_24730 [Herbaspirillum huttiense]
MLAGNSRYFALWYDVVRTTPRSIYGPFNVFVAGALLLDDVDAESELISIASDLKKTLAGINKLSEIPKYGKPQEQFLRSLHEHGYLSFEDPIVPDHWQREGSEKIREFMQTFNDLIEERRVDPPFGQEILMGPKLREIGWRFFLYSRGKREVVMISGDRGLTVMKRVLPKGSVMAAIYTFLSSEDFSLFPNA